MTDQEVSEAIAKWIKYSKVGHPSEPDYGDDRPIGYIPAGLESKYRSPQIWHAPEPVLEAGRDDYEKIEAVYKGLDYMARLHVTTYYFGQRPVPVPRKMQESINTFRGKVANEGRQ